MEIMRHTAGSRLFGTDTANSDTDYKAVHLPSRRDVFLGNTVNVLTQSTATDTQTNTKNDEDFTSLSFQKFVNLLVRMEVGAIETLFAEPTHSSDVWGLVRLNRGKFLSNKTSDFVGYAKGQAMRYAVRGKRLEALVATVDYLGRSSRKAKLSAHLLAYPNPPDGAELITKPDGLYLSCFGRSVPVNGSVENAINTFEKPIFEAGKRAIQSSGGTDWKGMYHAHRVVDEGLELFTTGKIQFPLKTASYLLDVRNGKVGLEDCLDFFDEKATMLECLTSSPFQDSVNMQEVEDFVVFTHDKYTV